jgi:hypothetical protein
MWEKADYSDLMIQSIWQFYERRGKVHYTGRTRESLYWSLPADLEGR